MSNIIKASFVKVNKNSTFNVFNYDLPLSENDNNDVENTKEELINESKKVEQYKQEASEIIKKAQEKAFIEAENIKKNAYEQIEIEKKEIYKKAQQKGYNSGKTNALEDYRNKIQQAEKNIEDTLIERDKILNSLEGQIVDFVNKICKKIINYEVEANSKIILYLIKSGLDDIKIKQNMKLRVNEANYNYIMENTRIFDQIVNYTMELKVDNTLDKGTCFIETVYGSVEVNVTSQLKEIERILYLIADENITDENKVK